MHVVMYAFWAQGREFCTLQYLTFKGLQLVSSLMAYSPGDKIFAKVKGHPHWPSRVGFSMFIAMFFQINLLPPDVSVPKGKYPIFFYGTHEVYVSVLRSYFLDIFWLQRIFIHMKSSNISTGFRGARLCSRLDCVRSRRSRMFCFTGR